MRFLASVILVLLGLSVLAAEDEPWRSSVAYITADPMPRSEKERPVFFHPEELTSLQPPCSILEASGWRDGGTTYVRLKDSRGVEIVLCVYQSDEPIPSGTLFLNAAHPYYPDARLPYSVKEAKLVAQGLAEALKRVDTVKLERQMKRDSSKLSEEDWRVLYAVQALSLLKSIQPYAIRDTTGNSSPPWYRAYDHQKQQRLAERNAVRKRP